MAEKWMQGVKESIRKKGTEGALTRQARAKGMSVAEFCRSGKKTGKTGRRCGLAKTFKRSSRKGGR